MLLLNRLRKSIELDRALYVRCHYEPDSSQEPLSRLLWQESILGQGKVNSDAF